MTKPKNPIARPSRGENMKHIIGALRKSPLNRFQVAELLKVTTENAGKYLCELKREGIVNFARPDIPNLGGYKRTAYVLIASAETIGSFVARLDSPVPPAVRQARLIADQARRDAQATIARVETAKVDPLALPRNFFSPTVDLAPPAERIERVPAKPTGFAALATVRFQLASEVCP